MGLMTKTKVSTIKIDAKKSFEKGRSVFLARYWDEVFNFQGTGEIAGASEAIESVEAEGWELKDIAYSWVDQKRRGLTIMAFRRKDK